jgi:formate dehydrogenase subunit delta
MAVNIEKLLKMAEQITANMSYTDDQSIIAAKVADHLNRFWDPRMKQTLRDFADSEPEKLDATLTEVVSLLND